METFAFICFSAGLLVGVGITIFAALVMLWYWGIA